MALGKYYEDIVEAGREARSLYSTISIRKRTPSV
jgi:hypothetical protein